MDEDLIRQQNRYAPATMTITLMSCDRNNPDKAFEVLIETDYAFGTVSRPVMYTLARIHMNMPRSGTRHPERLQQQRPLRAYCRQQT